MSVQTEIDRIITAVQAAHEKVVEKGGTTTQPYLVGNLASAIDTIPNATEPVLQKKTVTPTTAKQTIKPDSGYDGLSQVDVNAMPTATQATPSISVNSSGLITASAIQSAGYVAAGTKTNTKQLTTQAAQTITPSTSNKTIASGRYLTGTQTIKGDANLLANNIKSGVSIFGVSGSYEGSGGGGDATKYIEAQHEEVVLPTAKSIKPYAFYEDQTIRNVEIPNVTSVGNYAFYNCIKLELTYLPSGITSIGESAFRNCYKLALTSLPSGITSIGAGAFRSCTKLALTSLPSGITSIGNSAFYGCTKLALTYLPSGITSIGANAFGACKALTSLTFKSTPTTIENNAFSQCANLLTINVPWAEGEVANAPWGATKATINYNYTED